MNNRFVLVLVALLVSGITFAQSKETRNLDSFNSLSVGEAINVIITSGSEEKAVVEVSGSADLDDVLTEVSGDRLKIRMRDRRGGYRNVRVNIDLTYKQLERIRVSSAADLVTDNTLRAETLDVSASSAADVRLDIDVDELEAEVSSAADLEVRGRADRLRVRASSSGDFDGIDLESRIVRADASSSGDVSVHATEELDADASSAGNVRYKGNPKKLYTDANSGGRVKKY